MCQFLSCTGMQSRHNSNKKITICTGWNVTTGSWLSYTYMHWRRNRKSVLLLSCLTVKCLQWGDRKPEDRSQCCWFPVQMIIEQRQSASRGRGGGRKLLFKLCWIRQRSDIKNTILNKKKYNKMTQVCALKCPICKKKKKDWILSLTPNSSETVALRWLRPGWPWWWISGCHSVIVPLFQIKDSSICTN